MMHAALSPIPRERLVGFRFSPTDAVALVVGALLTVLAWRAVGALALLVPCVVGHYFLFCNVVRMRRSYELVWASFFVAVTALCAHVLGPPWPLWLNLGAPSLVTAALVWLEVRSPRYHGVFAERLNPQLDAYVSRRRAELA